MKKFYSHTVEEENGKREPIKLLKKHLFEVGKATKEKISVQLSDLKIPSKVAYFIGVSHDFGKYTVYFQDYLLYAKQDPSGRHHHGFISAIFASYLVEKFSRETDQLS